MLCQRSGWRKTRSSLVVRSSVGDVGKLIILTDHTETAGTKTKTAIIVGGKALLGACVRISYTKSNPERERKPREGRPEYKGNLTKCSGREKKGECIVLRQVIMKVMEKYLTKIMNWD